MFLDIKGLFGNTSIESTTKAVEKQSIHLAIYEWSASRPGIVAMRSTFSSFVVYRGRRPTTAVGYADDIIALLSSVKFKGTVPETMQKALNFVER